MTLSDNAAYRQIIGSLMQNPLLLLEYPDIYTTDFDNKTARICFMSIKNLFDKGAVKLTPYEVDQEIMQYENSAAEYKSGGGLELLKTSYEFAEPSNFKIYYTRLKKYSLLRRLKKEKYDISEFYVDDKDLENPLDATKIQEHFDESSLEDILDAIESKYNIIRNEYLNGGRTKGDPAEGIFQLIESLEQRPILGPSLEGQIFSVACRGAREGCFYLKSASTSAGKTRTSVFDACRLCYPIRWSQEKNTFIREKDREGNYRDPRKVLFIVTEMDKEELQTIMLAYLSGVDEDHILNSHYELGEKTRVKFAAHIIQNYSGFFIIEEISEPNLVNVEATIKKYATLDQVKYVFFDYIHTTASMVSQFARNNLREDSILMLMANQLKQIAKDYGVFIFSATQVNAAGMEDDGNFKNEMCIRGAKSVADKCDMGCVMTKITEKTWNSILPLVRGAIQDGIIPRELAQDPNFKPTHVIDLYKMRRGRFKNVRIWIYLHLGTGYRRDLFMTTADNQPIDIQIDCFTPGEEPMLNWNNILEEGAM